MRWGVLIAVAMTLGLVLAHWSTDRPARVSRLAAPRFGSAGSSVASGPDPRLPEIWIGPERNVAPVIGDARKRVEDTDPQELAHAGTWRLTLTHAARWGDMEEQAAAVERHLNKALAKAENPIARQNIIFLTVRALRVEDARRVLSPMLESASAGDVEDVVCALAFAGDDAMVKRFLALAKAPSPAAVAQLRDTLRDIEALAAAANESARDVLRSYRSFEVRAEQNYFRLAGADLNVDFPYMWSMADRRSHRIELWKAWLARYPGHPGSDDVAIMLGNVHRWAGAGVEAARWYDRASVLPDQYRTSKALRLLVEMAERELDTRQLRLLLEGDVQNRALLSYIAARRTASQVGCADAIDLLEELVARDPGGVLAAAWRRRSSGASVGPDHLRLGAVHDRIAGSRSPTERLIPPRVALTPSEDALARQFALWETVAALEQRMAAARGNAAADLLVELADLTLSERELFYPVYLRHTFDAGHFMRLRKSPEHLWSGTTVSAFRALELYGLVERLHPRFARMDEVLFGVASAWAVVLDYEPLDAGRHGAARGRRSRGDLRRVLKACARVSARYPRSVWASRAADLAADCRARYPGLARE